MMALIEAEEAVCYWKLLLRIFPNNVASRALMRSCSARSTASSLPVRDRNVSPMVSLQTTVRIGLAASGMRQAMMIPRTSQLPKPWRPGFEKTDDWFDDPITELEHRDAIRKQAFGSA